MTKLNAINLSFPFPDPASILTFYQTVHSRLADPNPPADPESSTGLPTARPPPPAAEAYALSLSGLAYAQLLNHMLDESKKSLDQCEEILAGLDDVEPAVNAGLYGVSADYYKVRLAYSCRLSILSVGGVLKLDYSMISAGQSRLRGVLQGISALPRMY
jgi:hypothetical protein